MLKEKRDSIIKEMITKSNRCEGMAVRNIGLDILRILSMIFVLTLHYLGAGGILEEVSFGTFEYVVSWGIEGYAFAGVNCFVLITGYFMSDKKWKLSGIVRLFIHILFYSICCYIVSVIIAPSTFKYYLSSIIHVLTPALSGEWWYVSCYIQLFFLMPILNAAIVYMDKKTYRMSLVVLLMITSLMPTFGIWKSAEWCTGNDVLWFVTLYLISAYIKKYNVTINSTKSLVIYFLSGGMMVISRLLVANLTLYILGSIKGENLMYTYNSILTVVMAISLFMCTKNISIKSPMIQKIITVLSQYSFGVYLWHANPNISKLLFQYIEATHFAHRPLEMIIQMLIFIVVCYLIGVGCDFIFAKFEQMVNLKKIILGIDLKINQINTKSNYMEDK